MVNSGRRITAALLALAALPLGGCGSSGSRPGAVPPLAAHLRILADVARCDPGAHRFCGRELVVVATDGRPRAVIGRTAAEERAAAPLMASERAALARAGWSASGGEIAGEASASSPGGARWVAYGPAGVDLHAIGTGNLKRAPAIVAALRREVAARAPALSLLVETGAG